MAGSLSKECLTCGVRFDRPKGTSRRQWESRLYCGRSCAATKCRVPLAVICKMYSDGASSTEIGAKVGLTPKCVIDALRRAGVERRTLSEAITLSHARPSVRQKMSATRLGMALPESAKAKLRLRTGSKNSNWTGGVTRSSSGYLKYTSSPKNGDRAGRFVHAVVAEEYYGRPVRAGEHVHHIDHDKSNNDPLNLVILSASAHIRYHAVKRKVRNAENA